MIDEPQFGIPPVLKPIGFFDWYLNRQTLQKIIDKLEFERTKAVLKMDFKIDRLKAEETIAQIEFQILKYEHAAEGLDSYPRKKKRWWHRILVWLYEWVTSPSTK